MLRSLRLEASGTKIFGFVMNPWPTLQIMIRVLSVEEKASID